MAPGVRMEGPKAMNLARLAASVAATAVLATSLAAAKPATVAADVNLRKGPGTDSEIVTLVPKGTMVEVGTCTRLVPGDLERDGGLLDRDQSRPRSKAGAPSRRRPG